MLTRKNSNIISFRIENKDWEAFKEKCRKSSENPFELIRNSIVEMIEKSSKIPEVDNYKYSYDSHNKTLRFEGIDKRNRSHVLAEYPISFLQTLVEDNINLAKNLIDIKNKYLMKGKKEIK